MLYISSSSVINAIDSSAVSRSSDSSSGFGPDAAEMTLLSSRITCAENGSFEITNGRAVQVSDAGQNIDKRIKGRKGE